MFETPSSDVRYGYHVELRFIPSFSPSSVFSSPVARSLLLILMSLLPESPDYNSICPLSASLLVAVRVCDCTLVRVLLLLTLPFPASVLLPQPLAPSLPTHSALQTASPVFQELRPLPCLDPLSFAFSPGFLQPMAHASSHTHIHTGARFDETGNATVVHVLSLPSLFLHLLSSRRFMEVIAGKSECVCEQQQEREERHVRPHDESAHLASRLQMCELVPSKMARELSICGAVVIDVGHAIVVTLRECMCERVRVRRRRLLACRRPFRNSCAEKGRIGGSRRVREEGVLNSSSERRERERDGKGVNDVVKIVWLASRQRVPERE